MGMMGEPHRGPRNSGSVIVMTPGRLPTRLEVLTRRYADDELTWWEFEDAVERALADGMLDEPDLLSSPFEGMPLDREWR